MTRILFNDKLFIYVYCLIKLSALILLSIK